MKKTPNVSKLNNELLTTLLCSVDLPFYERVLNFLVSVPRKSNCLIWY